MPYSIRILINYTWNILLFKYNHVNNNKMTALNATKRSPFVQSAPTHPPEQGATQRQASTSTSDVAAGLVGLGSLLAALGGQARGVLAARYRHQLDVKGGDIQFFSHPHSRTVGRGGRREGSSPPPPPRQMQMLQDDKM